MFVSIPILMNFFVIIWYRCCHATLAAMEFYHTASVLSYRTHHNGLLPYFIVVAILHSHLAPFHRCFENQEQRACSQKQERAIRQDLSNVAISGLITWTRLTRPPLCAWPATVPETVVDRLSLIGRRNTPLTFPSGLSL